MTWNIQNGGNECVEWIVLWFKLLRILKNLLQDVCSPPCHHKAINTVINNIVKIKNKKLEPNIK
jgi:hypothetical protein